jgi:uncharacterized protein YjiS (DUF1127 family)
MLHLALATTSRLARMTPTDRFSEVARTWWHSYRRRRRQKATVRALQGLDDRTLKDIGLDRSEIESVAGAGCRDERLRYIDIGDAIRRA